jgi:hypothetical protein
MRIFTLIILLFVCQSCFAVVKTWNGGAAGSWNTPGNWSPSGVPTIATSPLVGDDIVFDGLLALNVTITDYPVNASTTQFGQLSLSNGVTVNLSASGDTYMLFLNGLVIPAGNRINIGAATTSIFVFGSNSATGYSSIYGTIEMKGTGTNAVTNKKVFQAGITFSSGGSYIYGKLIFSGPSATFTSTTNVLVIQNGGEMQWARDGVASAVAPFMYNDGSILNITGIVTSPLILSDFGNYYGLLIWNCPSQTGFNIPIVPYVGLLWHLDSIRVINTGIGSSTLSATPCYSVGHLEVQGGIMNLGSPTSVGCGTYLITSDLKITGGTVTGNATFTGDAGSAYPMTLPVQRDFIMTGGTFNFTNRPTGLSPGGAIQLNVGRNVVQTGGTISASSSFGSQNQINMNGSSAQTLELSNINDILVAITNTSATFGVTLTNNLTLPSSNALNLVRGYLALGNYNLTLPATRFFQSIFTPMPKIVTSGYGKLKLTGITASSSTVFPVAPFAVNSYDPVTINTTAGAATNDYSVRVQRGIASGAMYSYRVMNRTWTINGTSTIIANTVGLTYQYNDTAKQALCIPSAGMEEGHFAGGVWNVDPAATLITPTGSNPYTVGPFYPSSIDSSFAIGNLASILAINTSIELAAQKNYNNVLLRWKTNSASSVKQFTVERSADGRDFTFLFNMPVINFSYSDMALLPGLNYYRIRMTDNDGGITYSNVATILNAASGANLLNIVPNPVTDGRLKMQVASAVAAEMNTQITDLLGRRVKQQTIHLIAGYNAVELNIAALAPGTYTIAGIVTGEHSKVLRFVKQ